MNFFAFPKTVASVAFLSASSVCPSMVLLTDDFDGTGSLDGRVPNFVSPLLTGAGAGWVAGSNFGADGVVAFSATGVDTAASFGLGSYIDDSKGTAMGKFTFEVVLSAVTGGDGDRSSWISSGFSSLSAFPDEAFFEGTPSGAFGHSVTRVLDDGANDYYAGPDTTGTNADVVTLEGPVTLTTMLDFTPAGGYDGASNFGTITFMSDIAGDPGLTFTYTDGSANLDVGSLGFTINDSADVTIGSISLTQVPEPSGAALVSLALFGGLLRRSRR